MKEIMRDPLFITWIGEVFTDPQLDGLLRYIECGTYDTFDVQRFVATTGIGVAVVRHDESKRWYVISNNAIPGFSEFYGEPTNIDRVLRLLGEDLASMSEEELDTTSYVTNDTIH